MKKFCSGAVTNVIFASFYVKQNIRYPAVCRLKYGLNGIRTQSQAISKFVVTRTNSFASDFSVKRANDFEKNVLKFRKSYCLVRSFVRRCDLTLPLRNRRWNDFYRQFEALLSYDNPLVFVCY